MLTNNFGDGSCYFCLSCINLIYSKSMQYKIKKKKLHHYVFVLKKVVFLQSQNKRKVR
jgi:hypothetical protein